VADLNIEGCEEIAKRSNGRDGGKAIAVKLNVTERDQMKAAVDAFPEDVVGTASFLASQ
jgi:meso-butanediol dehydrogenase / (S,S)-butanediol dehydrogenase / diacetyl reductase